MGQMVEGFNLQEKGSRIVTNKAADLQSSSYVPPAFPVTFNPLITYNS